MAFSSTTLNNIFFQNFNMMVRLLKVVEFPCKQTQVIFTVHSVLLTNVHFLPCKTFAKLIFLKSWNPAFFTSVFTS